MWRSVIVSSTFRDAQTHPSPQSYAVDIAPPLINVQACRLSLFKCPPPYPSASMAIHRGENRVLFKLSGGVYSEMFLPEGVYGSVGELLQACVLPPSLSVRADAGGRLEFLGAHLLGVAFDSRRVAAAFGFQENLPTELRGRHPAGGGAEAVPCVVRCPQLESTSKSSRLGVVFLGGDNAHLPHAPPIAYETALDKIERLDISLETVEGHPAITCGRDHVLVLEFLEKR